MTAAHGRRRARVLVGHGRRLRVRTSDGEELLVQPAQRQLHAVCGDWIELRQDAAHEAWLAAAVEPRRGVLHRSNARGAGELIAANLSLLLVAVAPIPQPDLFVVDRYLCAAACAGIGALIVLNKSDLPIDATLQAELQVLGAAGHEILCVSAQHGSNLSELRARLGGQTAILVGQSGTGKSSLLRALLPGSEAAVGALARDRTGRHTTTATRLYSLPEGGELLDSPGVRDFAPALAQLEPRALGFAEIEALAGGCRFADCRHLREPDCAVRAAVGSGIGARRYESYRRLRRLHDRLAARPTL